MLLIERRGAPVAALVHDAVLLQDRAAYQSTGSLNLIANPAPYGRLQSGSGHVEEGDGAVASISTGEEGIDHHRA